MKYQIKTTWNNQTIKDHDPIKIDLSWGEENNGNDDFITIKIEAPFFNDTAPEIPPENTLPKLWNYEGNNNKCLQHFLSIIKLQTITTENRYLTSPYLWRVPYSRV